MPIVGPYVGTCKSVADVSVCAMNTVGSSIARVLLEEVTLLVVVVVVVVVVCRALPVVSVDVSD